MNSVKDFAKNVLELVNSINSGNEAEDLDGLREALKALCSESGAFKTLPAEQIAALMAVSDSLHLVTTSGLFDTPEFLLFVHPDTLNKFCDALEEFAKFYGEGADNDYY